MTLLRCRAAAVDAAATRYCCLLPLSRVTLFAAIACYAAATTLSAFISASALLDCCISAFATMLLMPLLSLLIAADFLRCLLRLRDTL